MLMWKRITRWLVLSVLTTGFVIGCELSANHRSIEPPTASTQQSRSDCRIIEQTVSNLEICGQPQKVVALGVHALDLLLSLGVQPAGYAPPSNLFKGDVFDDPAQQIPYLGDRITTQPINIGSHGEPSIERLTLLKPDLIVGEANRNDDDYSLLSQVAPTLLCQDRLVKDQWQESLHNIATAIGNAEKAAAEIQRYETLVANARTDLAEVIAAYPKLLLLVFTRLETGIGVMSPNSALGALLGEVGFQIMATGHTSTAPISIEALPGLNDADSIIVLGYGTDEKDLTLERSSDRSPQESLNERVDAHQIQPIKQDWQESEIAQSLKASQANRVYFATAYKWIGSHGPIGAELILEDLRRSFRGPSASSER
ncbi:MAG: iron-siderophore ABC transporter substrate-binding protein [Symploca sp. SIO2G7]|nr:iron-siderophore ABC transporter substrate-binding protein [Symploca sp. SIO2G7]